jgi:hypothetical protein
VTGRQVSNLRRWVRYVLGMDVICPTCCALVRLSDFPNHSHDHYVREVMATYRLDESMSITRGAQR